MIGKLSGILDSVHDTQIILNVSGVGYLVSASARTRSQIGQAGDPVSLLIDTHVREDALNLYGFIDEIEQQWFRLLIGVQGVGAKAAFSILAVTSPNELGLVIGSGDKAMLTRADGVGPKLAARIVTELKDKVAKLDLQSIKLSPSSKGTAQALSTSPVASAPDAAKDALSALVNLGYGQSDAYSAIQQALGKANDNDNGKDMGVETLIRLALKELAS